MTHPATLAEARCGAPPLRDQSTRPSSRITASAAIASGESGTGHGSDPTFPTRATDDDHRPGVSTCRSPGDSGNVNLHAFCPVCGMPVYLRFVAMPDLIAVHAGSLDDPERFEPQALPTAYAVCRGTPSILRCRYSSGCLPASATLANGARSQTVCVDLAILGAAARCEPEVIDAGLVTSDEEHTVFLNDERTCGNSMLHALLALE